MVWTISVVGDIIYLVRITLVDDGVDSISCYSYQHYLRLIPNIILLVHKVLLSMMVMTVFQAQKPHRHQHKSI